MPTELQIREQLDNLHSLPPRLAVLVRSLGRTQWPGQPMRWDFPSGQELTADERQDLQARCVALATALAGSNLTADESSKAKLALVTKLVDGSAMGQISDTAADARLEMYEFALEDIPPWAIDVARRRWARREVPASIKGVNFAFAPSPADLRLICLDVMAPYQGHLAEMRKLLSAVSIERAMDPTPLPPPVDTSALTGANVKPMLRKA